MHRVSYYGRDYGKGSNGDILSSLSYDARDLGSSLDSLVQKVSERQQAVGFDSQQDCYRETRSYAEQVIRMFSSDRTISKLNGKAAESCYNLADRVKLYFTGIVDKQAAARLKRQIDKKTYLNLLGQFCSKYEGVLEAMKPKCANTEKLYESLRMAHDEADVASRRAKGNCKQFNELRERAIKLAGEKREQRAKAVEDDPFDKSADRLTSDLLFVESKARRAANYSRVCVSKAESNEMLRQGYERDTRIAGQLMGSCNYITDTLYRNIAQFSTLIKMHSTIGDADDFEELADAVQQLAKKTSELSRSYYEHLPSERELGARTSPYDEVNSQTNAALLEMDITSADDIESRLARLDELHSKQRML